MKIIEFYQHNAPVTWIDKIDESDWRAGKYLAELLKKNEFRKLCGENSEVLLLTENDKLLSFCTLSDQDEIPDTNMMPWIGFVYTFPQYRGNHYIGILFEYAHEKALKVGYNTLYVSTDQKGLYEKFGFEYTGIEKTSIYGELSMIYKRNL